MLKSALTTIAALGLCSCAAPAPVPATGTYRATGTEPFWSLVIGDRAMSFSQPASPPIEQPTPRVIVGIAGEIYRTPRLDVNIVHGKCSDGMSDRTYPDKVQVTVDGRVFQGCGGL